MVSQEVRREMQGLTRLLQNRLVGNFNDGGLVQNCRKELVIHDRNAIIFNVLSSSSLGEVGAEADCSSSGQSWA